MPTVHSHRSVLPKTRRELSKIPKTGRTALAGLVAGSVGAGLLAAVAAPATSASAAVPAVAKVAGAASAKTGQAVTLHAIGTVRGRPAAYKTFSLQYHLGGSRWKTVSTKRARPSGQLEWNVKPGGTSDWRVVLYVDGAQRTASRWHRIAVTGGRGAQVVALASRQSGKPYVYAAAGPNAFDCSGFTQYVYKKFGRALPHSATKQARYGTAVGRGSMKPGDLILFGSPAYFSHAGIYAGGNYMIDASTPGQPVALRKIWSSNFVARRLV
ncbi:MAG TPA: NlpC/P60 family protein [Streptomyces sp.]|nr:NlpC/P60 family protein [Streptomyces sp.]